MASKPASASDDAALLARVHAGDDDSLRTLFDRHLAAMEATVRRLLPRAVRRRVSVSDVVQEARIVAFARTETFEARRDGAYRAWLLRIAELKAREALRAHAGTSKRAVGREVSRGPDSRAPEPSALDPSPSEGAMAAERRRAVLRTLATLSPDDRDVLRLARIDGRPIREVAVRMGRSTEAVKKLYGRALVRFAKAFTAAEGEGP